MTTKIGIICDPTRFSAKLQNLFVKNPHPAFPYHAIWMTDTAIYDMNWTFRKLPRDYYEGSKKIVKLFDSPVEISDDYFEMMLGKRKYGTMDVLLYPLFQAVGLNWWGTHCSEAVNDDLWFSGYMTPWIPYGAPPSPADLLHWLESK